MEYPKKYETHLTMKDGTHLFLRPVLTTDAPLVKDFYDSLSERTKYLRFFIPKKEARTDRIQKFTTIDYEKSMVIVALCDDAIVGAARYDWDDTEKCLELAETVRDDWQGRGLGTSLFRYILKIAKESGYAEMTALILDENKNAFNILKKTIAGDQKISYEGNLIRVTFAL
jgi:N-acetylglutamate synthase-like GNAT family acetyltransferase